MTLQEMITDIDSRYPNEFSDAEKIRWINRAIKKVYRYIAVDDTTDIDTVADQAIYDFPSGVIPENIESMTMSVSAESADDNLFLQRHLKPLQKNDPLEYNSYAKIDESTFMVHPTPTSDGQVIRIYYQVQPPNYTTSDLAEDLEDYLRGDYLDAIEYRTIYTMCENNDDIAKANNYARRYQSEMLSVRAEEYYKDGKFPKTRDVNKSLSRNRRYKRRSSKGKYYRYSES